MWRHHAHIWFYVFRDILDTAATWQIHDMATWTQLFLHVVLVLFFVLIEVKWGGGRGLICLWWFGISGRFIHVISFGILLLSLPLESSGNQWARVSWRFWLHRRLCIALSVLFCLQQIFYESVEMGTNMIRRVSLPQVSARLQDVLYLFCCSDGLISSFVTCWTRWCCIKQSVNINNLMKYTLTLKQLFTYFSSHTNYKTSLIMNGVGDNAPIWIIADEKSMFKMLNRAYRFSITLHEQYSYHSWLD